MTDDHAAELAVQALGLLNTALGTLTIPWAAYEADKAPKKGGNYVAITLTRRYGGNLRNGGPISPSAWRLTTRAVGAGIANTRVLLRTCTQALEDQQVTVSGVTSTPLAFEVEDPIAEDEFDVNLWSGLRSWTFAF